MADLQEWAREMWARAVQESDQLAAMFRDLEPLDVSPEEFAQDIYRQFMLLECGQPMDTDSPHVCRALGLLAQLGSHHLTIEYTAEDEL